jgi:hypothetical protein
MLTRVRGRGQRAFGIFALGGGVLGAIGAAMLIPGTAGLAIALLAGLVGVGIGAFAIRSGARAMEQARAGERKAREAAVLEVAREHGGRLTAAELGNALEIDTSEADELLTSMVGDGSRVKVRVDDEGVVRYVLLDAEAPAARVRVQSNEEPVPHTLERERAELGAKSRDT